MTAETSENRATEASRRLDSIATGCRIVYIVIAVVGDFAGFVIAVGADGDYARLALGFGLITSITVSLLPVLLLCRWAQAYAVDLEMRASGR